MHTCLYIFVHVCVCLCMCVCIKMCVCMYTPIKTNLKLYICLQVIAHWSSPAPELKLLPAKLIPVVQNICSQQCVDPKELSAIHTHSSGLGKLILYDKTFQAGNRGTSEAGNGCVSLCDKTVALLKTVLQKAQAGLTGKSTVTTKPRQSNWQPTEDMIRTGTFAPSHPVFRSLPFFKYDYLNRQQVERYARNKEEALKSIYAERAAISQRLGSTCNKHKTRQNVLSSGVFTILCNNCGLIEYFELMCKPESPATPARALFHRKWRPNDHS